MKIYLSVIVLAVLIIVVFGLLLLLCVKSYFVYKAKNMTDMDLIKAQIKEWKSGWFHELKYEIYDDEFKNRTKMIPPSHVD